MLGAVDVNAELDALQEHFVAVNDRIFTDSSNPTVAALSAEFLDIANWIDEIRYDLMMMRMTDRTHGSLQ